MPEITQIEEVEYNNEVNFSLSTNQGHKAVKTLFLKGELKTLILSTDKVIDILIKFKNYNINIFEVISLNPGDYYLPLRIEAITDKYEKFNYTQCKWYLNDEIEIIIEGNIETNVNFTFRL